MRLKVSRHEIPASTRILVEALATSAQLPRLPEASMETLTPMAASIPLVPVESRVTFVASQNTSGRPLLPPKWTCSKPRAERTSGSNPQPCGYGRMPLANVFRTSPPQEADGASRILPCLASASLGQLASLVRCLPSRRHSEGSSPALLQSIENPAHDGAAVSPRDSRQKREN